MTIDGSLLGLIVFGLLINFVAFIIMWIDKIKSARSGSPRISEGLLFFLATIFGSVGVYLGMFAFRHKTRKWYFLVGMPLLMLENFTLLYFIYNLI